MKNNGLSLKELSEIISGKISAGTIGDSGNEPVITGASPIESALPGDVSFIADARYVKQLATTRATAVILKERDINDETERGGAVLIFTDNPHLAMAKALKVIRPVTYPVLGVINPRATVHDSVKIGLSVSIGANSVIEEGVILGDRVIVYPNVYIGHNAEIGEETILYPNVTVMDRSIIGAKVIIHSGTVIGSDGFGYAKDGEQYYKIPQTGIVRIADNVEIGANTTIDRAMFGATTIGRGTKIDNLVQIAHNVTIGENSIIVAQVGISGSTSVGSRVQFGGQAGVVGHVNIGNDILIGAKGGVTNDITAPGAYSGFPAINHGNWLRSQVISQKLPELKKRVRELERKVVELEDDGQ